MTDLRTLAQAVVDAANTYADRLDPLGSALDAAEVALGLALGLSTLDHEAARAILAALDDAAEQGRAAGDAKGYARAMRQTATYAEREAVVCFSPLLKLPSKGDAFERVARWCREHAEVPRG